MPLAEIKAMSVFVLTFIATLIMFSLLFVYLPLQPVDEFCFTNINAAELIIDGRSPSELRVSGFFVSHLIEFYHRFYPHMIFAVLSTVTGVKPDLLILWPAPIILAFLSLWLSLKIINASIFSRTLFVSLFVSTLSMNFFFEFYYISFGFSLFLLFAYLILRYRNDESPIMIILWIMLFLAMAFSHYAAAVSAIVLLFLHRLRTRRLWLVVAFIAIFISLEVITYTQTSIQIALFNMAHSSSQQIYFNLQKYFENLISTTSQPSAFIMVDPYFTNPIIQTAGSLNRIASIAYIVLTIIILYRSKNVNLFIRDVRFWFILSLYATGIVEVIIYLLMNFGILQRLTTIALLVLMAYLWPPTLIKNNQNKSVICSFLAVIAVLLATCLPILNFARTYTFSLEYGTDYYDFCQKANQPILFLLLHNGSLIYTDHYTDAILTYKAIHLNIKHSLQTVILKDELPASNTGYFLLPSVKALRAGWSGHIPSSNFLPMLIEGNVIYTSGSFQIYQY